MTSTYTTGTWTSPQGKEWFALYGKDQNLPVVVFGSQSDLDRFMDQMKGKQGTS